MFAPAASAVASPTTTAAPSVPSAGANVLVDPVTDLGAAPLSRGRAPASMSAAAAGDPIVCTPNVQDPHPSSHVPGTVNVVVTVSCTEPVAQIRVEAALYLQNPTDQMWYLQSTSDVATFNDTVAAQNNAAAPCQDGNWAGWMWFSVTFYDGYTGQSQGFGPRTTTITCPTT
jgi:hypothetical protein